MDLISIIVPVYKVEKYINRCINSIVGQSYTNLEIILVDDGSPDNCGEICDSYAREDNRIRVIHKANGGLSDARNHGIETATGKWLMFVDSDDWIHPQTVEKLYEAVKKQSVRVSVCNYEETHEKNPQVDLNGNIEIKTPKELYLKNNIAATVAWNKLYSKECFASIRYPVGKIHEDEYVTYRILFEQEKIAFIDQPFYAYFINPEGITKSRWNPKRLDAVDAFNEQLKYFKFIKDNDLTAFKLRSFFWNLFEQKKQIDPDIYPKEFKHIKRYLLKLIMFNYRFFLNTSNAYMTELVYPVFMKCYWLARAAIRKFLRRK